MRCQPALPFGGNPMKDSNQTPYDWEKDEGVFDQTPSSEQEEEVRPYGPAPQEEKKPSPDPQEEHRTEQEIRNEEELDADYRSLLEQISAARSAKFYSSASIPEQEESEYSQFTQPKPERAEGFRLQIEEEGFDEPVAPESPAYSGQPAALEETLPEIHEPEPPKTQKNVETPAVSGLHRRKKRFLLLKALLFAAVVIMISIYLSNVILGAAYDLFGLKKEDIDIEVDIPQGSSTQQIAEILDEKNVINEPMVFRIYSRLKKADGTYQYGTYTLNAKMSYDEIIRKLQELVPRKDVVSITFPEGYTAVDMAKLLEENGVCSASNFLEVVRTGDISHDVVKNIKASQYRYYSLEGYLFPDTYEFYTGESVDSVVRRFLDNFQKYYDSVIASAMQNMDMSLDQILTLASMIQAEAPNSDQMRMVSSVFYNRLNNSGVFPLLQSDPTGMYVTNDILPYLNIKDDGYYSAYDTYVCTGLPVGPICNTGLDAIEAALDPANSDYYFFVTDAEGNFYYAVTDQEHEINKKKAGLA